MTINIMKIVLLVIFNAYFIIFVRYKIFILVDKVPLINSFISNGLIRPCQLDESILNYKGCWVVFFFIFVQNFIYSSVWKH